MQEAIEQIRVVVIDDEAITHRRVVEALLATSEFELVGEAYTAGEGLIVAEEERPDVVLVDVMVHGAHGLEVIRQLRAESNSHVVVYSYAPEEEVAGRCIHAGALGFVSKRAEIDEALEAIRTAAREEAYVSDGVMTGVLTKMLRGMSDDPCKRLTARELTVFEKLGDEQRMSAIAEELGLSRKTVEVYRRRIREKLGLRSIPELMEYAARWNRGLGMRSLNDDHERWPTSDA